MRMRMIERTDKIKNGSVDGPTIDDMMQTVSYFVLTMTRMKRPAMPMIPQPVAK